MAYIPPMKKYIPPKKVRTYPEWRTPSEKKYHQEVDKQYEIIYGAAVIILRELYHWGDKRIKKALIAADQVFKEIKMQGDMQNVMQICEEETGIIMKLRGKPYKNEDVFSYEWANKVHTITELDYIYDCSRPWVANGFIASLLIGLHRKEKWGNRKRLPEFLENIEGVRGEWRSAYQYKELLKERYDIQFSLE